MNGTHQLLAYADDANEMSGNINTIKKNTEALLQVSKVEESWKLLMPSHQNAGQNKNAVQRDLVSHIKGRI
jgi:hypothetical protein